MQEVVSAFGAVGLKLDAEISGDIFINGFGQLMRVSNNLAVPDSEEVVLRKIEQAVSGLVTQEEQARLRVLGNAGIKKILYNKIACSLAVLKNAVIMERAQSYEELSWFRTGVAMGLVKGMTLAQVDKLTRDIWSSNFLSYFRGSFDEAVEHVAVTRASVLRERLRCVKVTFI
jgi:protein-arginine kinase